MKKNTQTYLGIAIIGVSIVFLIYSIQNNLQEDNLETSSSLILTYDEKLRNFPIENAHVKKIFSKCGIEEHCTVEELWVLSKLEDKETVLSTAKEILSTYEEAEFFCHENGHHLGMFVYGFLGDVSEAISTMESRCGGSVYHGIVENYFVTAILLKNENKDELKIANICDDVSEYDLEISECLHGVGHGLAEAYNHDVQAALNRCDEFDEPEACYNGVSMESSKHYLEDNKDSLNGKNIIQYCHSLDEKYQQPCYQYQTQNILISNNFSMVESFSQCEMLENSKEIRYCYYGIGTQIFGQFFYDFERLVEECQKGSPEYHDSCFHGNQSVIIDQLGFDKAFEFCKIVPEEFKPECYAKNGNWLAHSPYSKDEIEQACSAAENEKYYENCVTGKYYTFKCSAIQIKNTTNGTITEDITDMLNCGF